MSTFIGQLIGFAVIVWIIVKYVVPPVRRLMTDQKETVRTQLEDSAKAAKRLAAADQYHAQRVEQGRVEAKHIVEELPPDAFVEQISERYIELYERLTGKKFNRGEREEDIEERIYNNVAGYLEGRKD